MIRSYVAADSGEAGAGSCILLVVGAPGTPEYGREFEQWAGRWQEAARAAGIAALLGALLAGRAAFAVGGLDPGAVCLGVGLGMAALSYITGRRALARPTPVEK